ncbi:hypothetical protein [Rhizobium sp. CCGE 510]|uniref:hypothetical protein n=1 Tax=Rhizobium sp. CCGE 510 TaxID=1132836 RepID=UPI0012F6A6CB|nr:hypothetical protein [Rhizobium sp. CCGE 510]
MKRLLACLMVAAGMCGTADAAATPRFKDYPATIYSDLQAPLRFDTPRARQYRSRLEAATNDDINFGGRYVFTQWGTSSGCNTGALIDIKTGTVHFVPFAACNWQGFERPFEVRPNSRLMVVAGQINGDGARGAHFFEFDGKEFKSLYENVSPLATIEPAAGSADEANAIDICKGAVYSVDLTRTYWGSTVPVLPASGTAKNPNYEWKSLPSNKDVKVMCTYDERGRKYQEFDISTDIERCTFADRKFRCFAKEGAAGETTLPDESSIQALSDAVLFAVHRPVFNKGWESQSQSFGHTQATNIARAFYATSIRKAFERDGSKYILMYNVDADMFAMIRTALQGDVFAGFVSGQQISEELYKHTESPQYLANILAIRPGVVKHFFDHYEDIKAPDDLFRLYRLDVNRSLPVNRNMVSYIKVLSAEKICRDAFQKMLDTAQFRFEDGKTAKDIGKFYLSIWFAQLEDENGTVKVDGTAAFRDLATNRYGGYLIFDPKDTSCKPTKLITNSF